MDSGQNWRKNIDESLPFLREVVTQMDYKIDWKVFSRMGREDFPLLINQSNAHDISKPLKSRNA